MKILTTISNKINKIKCFFGLHDWTTTKFKGIPTNSKSWYGWLRDENFEWKCQRKGCKATK